MKKNAIHENLSTSFVDLAALVKYLSRLQFAGSVRLELSSYEAEIRFSGGRTVEAREIDHSSGRIAKGDHALERILVRAQEPCGRINVYRDGSQLGGKVYVDETIVLRTRRSASETADSRSGTFLGGSPTRTILPHVKIGGVERSEGRRISLRSRRDISIARRVDVAFRSELYQRLQYRGYDDVGKIFDP